PLRDRDGAPAPLIVRPHPGPTHNWELRFDTEVQFFTSRGYAVADVDYRGSTGYGRAFRKALDGQWGTIDVADCRAAALHFIASGRAMPQAVFISGASAGGYTALRAACLSDSPFAVSVARSSIIDPRGWTQTAPRFQQPHAAILSGEDSFIAAADVKRPVLLIHGGRDNIAPASNVVDLAAELDRRDLLLACVVFPDAGHSLSAFNQRAETLRAELDAYEAVLRSCGLRR
ncbi:MAG: alpha/beta hydrolase family protein, partial [Burkholderiales bacterium]